MSTNRLEALRLATSISGDPEKVVGAAQKFYEFLNDAIQPSSPPATAETSKVDTPVEEPTKQTTAESTPELPIKDRVAALAKTLVKKDRPKLVAILDQFKVTKASLIPDADLPKAEEAFTKALAA